MLALYNMHMKDDIVEYLKELVRFRQKEFAQIRFAGANQKVLMQYDSKTCAVQKKIDELVAESKKSCAIEAKPLTIDEAIQHADEVAQKMLKDDMTKQCSSQHKQIACWLKELKDLRSKYKLAMQMAADYDNYKKRVQKQMADFTASANKDIILKILSIVDDFERVEVLFKDYENNAVVDGIKLIYKNLLKMLDAEGCSKIDCHIGDQFDVQLHDAVSTTSTPDGDICMQTVYKIVQSGWELHGKVIRPVKVVVAQ